MGFIDFVISNLIYLFGVLVTFGGVFMMADDAGLGLGVFVLGILMAWYARYRRQQGK